MWGVSAGTWDGKPINRFDIVHISVAITNTGKTFTAGEGNWYAWKPNEHTSAYMDSYALTNRGYGPAYFFNGIVEFNKSNDALIGNSATFFAFDAWNYGLGDSSNYRAVNATIYNPSTNSASYNQGWGINYQNIDTRKEQLKKWCMKGLSDAYNQRINWIDSTVDLVEFLDAGDVAMSFYSVKNGYAEELTTSPYYGMVANEVCTTLQQTQSVVKFVYTKKATGTQTTIMDMKTCADKTWIDWSQTVEAGDKIQFICQTGGGINGTWSNYLNYAFAFFTNQINGWERETT